MINLLKANFYKMKKSKAILIAALLSAIVAVYYIKDNYNIYHDSLELVNINSMIFNYLPVFGIIVSILISTILGFDYSYGSTKNKIIAGHSRINIYLSNLFSIYIVNLLVYSVYFFIICISGIVLFKNLTFNLEFIINILIILLIILSYVSISTFIVMIISNEIVSPVINVINAFFLILISFVLLSALSELKYIHSDDGYYFSDEGQKVADTENPMYIKGIKRDIYKLTVNILPTGEAFQKSRAMNTKSYIIIFFSSYLVVAINTLGIYLFSSKELN